MKIIVISPSKTSEDEPKIVTQLFEHGLQTFHLRKPTMPTRDMRKYLEKIPAHFHNRIIIHSHHGLMRSFDLKGIHITRAHMKKKFSTALRIRLLQVRKPGMFVTTSFHKIASIYENDKQYNYVLLGTIFDIVSEKFNAGYNEHSLRAGLQKSRTPVIARGGTQIGNVDQCHELGFAGMIFYSGVWKKDDPLAEFCNILGRCRELNITVE
jgi:thiamine-phosphate pyrophosphorylase